MSIQIRPIELADAESAAVLWGAAWRTAYRGLVPAALLRDLSMDDATDRFRSRLDGRDPDPESSMNVAELQGRVVGFCGFGPEREAHGEAIEDVERGGLGEIRSHYIDPDHWREGVGTALTRASCLALDSAYKRIMIWVLRDNAAARNFYQSQGFAYDSIEETHIYFDTPMQVVRRSRQRPP